MADTSSVRSAAAPVAQLQPAALGLQHRSPVPEHEHTLVHEESEQTETGSAWLKIGVLTIVVAAVVLCLIFLPVTHWLIEIFEWIEQREGWGIVFIAGIYIPVALFSLPSSIVNLGCGVIWGRW